MCYFYVLFHRINTNCFIVRTASKFYVPSSFRYLQLMIHSNPEMRPSAIALIQHRVLCPLGNKTKAQLRRELNAEKVKNEILSKQLQQAAKYLKTLAPNVAAISNTMNAGGYKLRPTPTRTSSRIVGKKVNRSSSTTNF